MAWHEIGTKVQYRNGYIKVKLEGEGGKPIWEAESRRVWELQRGPLDPGDRVYHVDGDRTNNRLGNLAKVHFNSTKFVFLKASRILFTPKRREKKEIVYHESTREMDRRIAVDSASRRNRQAERAS